MCVPLRIGSETKHLAIFKWFLSITDEAKYLTSLSLWVYEYAILFIPLKCNNGNLIDSITRGVGTPVNRVHLKAHLLLTSFSAGVVENTLQSSLPSKAAPLIVNCFFFCRSAKWEMPAREENRVETQTYVAYFQANPERLIVFCVMFWNFWHSFYLVILSAKDFIWYKHCDCLLQLLNHLWQLTMTKMCRDSLKVLVVLPLWRGLWKVFLFPLSNVINQNICDQ